MAFLKLSFFLLPSIIIGIVHSQTTSPPPPSKHNTLHFHQTANVTTATISNPPINLLTDALVSDLHTFLTWLQPAPNKTTPKVVIFQSANPDFYLAHGDVNNLLLPAPKDDNIALVGAIEELLVKITTTAFIAAINGRVNGVGNEIALHMDMRFAGPNARVVQYENSLGLAAAVGGELMLVPLIGRAKPLEFILAAEEFDAVLGTQLGYFNNHFPSISALSSAVDCLGARIGLFPQHSLNNSKATLNKFYPPPRWQEEELAVLPGFEKEKQGNVRKHLELSKNQTDLEFERGVPNSLINGLYGTRYPVVFNETELEGADGQG